MNADGFHTCTFASREDASQYVADTISNSISRAVENRGRANILLSGGSTPRRAYEILSTQSLEWEKVSAGLVDDRWVDEHDNGSNAKLIHETLQQNAARKLNFISMKTDHRAPIDGLPDIERRMASLVDPIDICVMGMGTDGHTASWFPGSRGLENALDIDNQNILSAIDAKGCPGAGKFPDRVSLTLPCIMNSTAMLLFITGAEKKNVWESSLQASVMDAPVKALRAAGQRLTVVWAP